MERHGCCKTGKADKTSLEFGREHNGKTLEEKIKLIPQSDIAYIMQCALNADGTLSTFWGEDDPNGISTCGCYTIRELPKPVDISKTYCACCGGLQRHIYQNALSVQLRLIEVVSSRISSGGKKKCEFLFEIIGE